MQYFEQKETKQSKYVYIELLRIIAIYFVIFNHTGNNGFFLFSQRTPGSLQFWVYLFISIFCKFSVPLFFAISGALMLGKNDISLKKLYKNKILKIFGILLIWSLIYYVYDCFSYNVNFSFWGFFKTIYSKQSKIHLWYLYAYIAYLMSIPFLNSLVKSLKKEYYYYLIIIVLIFEGILPMIEYYFFVGEISINSNLRMGWLLSYIVLYPCIGYFMKNMTSIKNKNILILWGINIVFICMSCYMTYFKGYNMGLFQENLSQSFHNSFVILNCISFFLTIKMLFENRKINGKLEKIIITLGKNTFGIYLFHFWFIERNWCKQILYAILATGLNDMLSTMIYSGWILFFAFFLSYILSKIPIIKKIIGC